MKKIIVAVALITFNSQVLAVDKSSERIQQLEKDLQSLTNFVVKLELRMKTLEGGEETSRLTPKQAETRGNTGWNNKNAWSRLKRNMSQEQVIAILGQPTSFSDNYTQRYFVYEGDVAGSGHIKGRVVFFDGQMGFAEAPVFLD